MPGERLLLDEMYAPALAATLRERDVDTVAVLDRGVGLAGHDDLSVLRWAASSERALVTENVADFARLAGSGEHAGLVMVLAARFPRTRSGLARLEVALTALVHDGMAPGRGEVSWLGSA